MVHGTIYFPHQQQGGMIVFEGSRRQRGGNLFSTIKKTIFPFLKKKVAPVLKSTAKDVAKRGVKVGVNAIKDRLTGNAPNLKEALKQHTAKQLSSVVKDYLGDDEAGPDPIVSSQDGAGLRRRRKRKASTAAGRPAKRRRSRRRSCRRKRTPKRKKSINKMKTKRKTRRRRRRRVKFNDIFS